MPGKPWSRSSTEFIIKARYFRAVPGPSGIELFRWSFRLRKWEPLGVFATRAEARAEARRVMEQESD